MVDSELTRQRLPAYAFIFLRAADLLRVLLSPRMRSARSITAASALLDTEMILVLSSLSFARYRV